LRQARVLHNARPFAMSVFICAVVAGHQSAACAKVDPEVVEAKSNCKRKWLVSIQRKASAAWRGGLKDGKGTVSSTSKVLSNTPYSFTTRFENTPGTNPEELIAAAHAACFSMALSAQLGSADLTPESINTTATLTMEKLDAGFTITAIQLDVTARVPKADEAAFNKAAEDAKSGCPVSKVLKAKITMNAKLES